MMRKLIKYVLLPLAIIMLLASIYSYNAGSDYETRTLRQNELLLVEDKDWYDNDNFNFVEFTAPANTAEIIYAFNSDATSESTPSLKIVGGGIQVSSSIVSLIFPKLGKGLGNIGDGLVELSEPHGRFDCNAGLFTNDGDLLDCVLHRRCCKQNYVLPYTLSEPQRLHLVFSNEDSWNNVYVKASIFAIVQTPPSPIPMVFWSIVSILLIIAVAKGKKEKPITISTPESKPIREPEQKIESATVIEPEPIVVEQPKLPLHIPICQKLLTPPTEQYSNLYNRYNEIVDKLNTMFNELNNKISSISTIKNQAVALKNDKRSNVNKAKCATIIQDVAPIVEKYKAAIDRNRVIIDNFRDLGVKIENQNPNYINSLDGEVNIFETNFKDIEVDINAPDLAVKKLQNDFDTITNNKN